jgi:hypothetical protein
MVCTDDGHHFRVDGRVDDQRALDRVAVDLAPFVGREGARLLEDAVVDEQLADVVQQGAGNDGLPLDMGQLEPAGQPVGAGGDEYCVLVRVFLAGLRRDDPACGGDREGGIAGSFELEGGGHGLPLSGDAGPILPLS